MPWCCTPLLTICERKIWLLKGGSFNQLHKGRSRFWGGGGAETGFGGVLRTRRMKIMKWSQKWGTTLPGAGAKVPWPSPLNPPLLKTTVLNKWCYCNKSVQWWWATNKRHHRHWLHSLKSLHSRTATLSMLKCLFIHSIKSLRNRTAAWSQSQNVYSLCQVTT